MKLNKDKNIGTVLFIVEGSKTEFVILQHIFCSILDFEYVEAKRNKPSCFKNKNNGLNRIYVVNSSESNVSQINDKEFMDELFESLISKYNLDVDNCATFYLYDRDTESNTNPDIIRYYIDVLKDPYEDSDEGLKSGLFLLSYPSVESYIFSNFKDSTHTLTFKLGSDLKREMGSEVNRRIMQKNKISEDSILHAYNEFIDYLDSNNFEFDIENLSAVNKAIFESEEIFYKEHRLNHLISQLSEAFLYLGIIEV